MKKAFTVYDIAREAQVSPATVSRVLNGNVNVSGEKRDRVRSIMEEHNFVPNALARSLIKKESKMIGFILPDITNPFFGAVFLETEKYAVSLGYTILLCNFMNEDFLDRTGLESLYLRTLVEKKVDGIIMTGGRVNDSNTVPELAAEICEIMEQVPVVMINGRMEGVDCYRVTANEKDGVIQLVDYLYRIGHRKFGFIGGKQGVTSTDIKIKTLQRALKSYNLSLKKEWVVNGTFSIESGAETMNKLLDNRDIPTAVLAVNDFVAVGALNAAKKRGYKIPGDISITGFDNTYITDIVSPNITTVDQNYSFLGKTAVDIIVNLCNGKKPNKINNINTRIVIKDSCSAV